ncbi:uncharacterized protein ISCGN_019211 [Ixodes scapularis]
MRVRPPTSGCAWHPVSEEKDILVVESSPEQHYLFVFIDLEKAYAEIECPGIVSFSLPFSLRLPVLTRLHEGHQGINRSKARAREPVWWPGITAEITSMVTNFEQCASTRVNLSEPLVSTPLPGRPWDMLGVDLFHLNGQTFILVVDYYSRFPEVVTLRSTRAQVVIDVIKSIFARHGIPQRLRSDNGPPFFSREFTYFAKSYGFDHVTSSPHFAQSNGGAERMIRTIKYLFRKADDPNLALLSYRDTPGLNDISPAQFLMGRQLKTRVPKRDEQLRPNWPAKDKVASNDLAYKRQQAANYNRRHAARDLPSLRTGEQVWNVVVFFNEISAILCLSVERHNHKMSPNQRNTPWFLYNHDLQARQGRPLPLSRSQSQLTATVSCELVVADVLFGRLV